jgi:EmrB/QacA subfamily drug resistance transporter
VTAARHRDASHELAVEQHSWGATLSKRRLYAVLAALMMGMLLAALDQTVVGTAMPRVIADLNGMSHYAWVATAYLLAETASMPIWGKLSDAYGRRLFFIIGMVLFLVGSVLCGQAHSMTELILFRGLQGLGGGAMMPVAQAIIGDLFPPKDRGKWLGLFMAVFGLATIIGPTLGGWITDNWGWRWTFYVNLPFGIVALILVVVALPGHVQLRKHRIDYLGATALIAAAVPLLLGFSWAGSDYAWDSPLIISLFTFSAIMWVVFVFVEKHAAEPVLSPSLFTDRTFAVSAVAGFIAMAGMFGAIMYLPLFVQGVQGNSATSSGMVLTPMMLGFIVSSIVGGQLLSRWGRYKILLIMGFVVTIVGLWLLSRMGTETTNTAVVINMVITGLGMGMPMAIFTIVVQNAFPLSRVGEVTAGLQFFRSIGGTIGLAIFGTLLNNQFRSSFLEQLPAPLKPLVAGKEEVLGNPQALVSPEAKEQIADGFRMLGEQGEDLFRAFMSTLKAALATAISDLFLLGALLTVAGLVVVFFLREVPLRDTQSMEGDEGGPAPADGARGLAEESV